MENIEAILKEFGLEVPADKKEQFNKKVAENYKTVKDYNNQKEKLDTAEEKVKNNETAMKDLQAKLDGFKDVDVSGLKEQIETLKAENEKKDKEYAGKIADRDFNDLVTGAITAAHGKNAKTILPLLDVDTLKASKNQKEDVAAAIKTLSEAEDSKFLFGEPDPKPVGKGDPIGTIGGGSEEKTTSLKDALAEKYKAE